MHGATQSFRFEHSRELAMNIEVTTNGEANEASSLLIYNLLDIHMPLKEAD